MGSDKSDIFAVLIEDHKKLRALLAAIDKTEGASKERKALFDEFAVEAKGHAAAEEQSLYATMMAKPPLTEEARHSVAEHKEVEDLINELAEMDMSSSGWITKFRHLTERFTHHIDEEEEEMFPAAEKELTQADEIALRKIFETRKPKEKALATVGEDGEHRD